MTIRFRRLRILTRFLAPGALLTPGLLAMLTACGNPLYGAQQSRSEIVADRVAVAENPTPGPVIYCYRTLAVPDCRTTPEPGQENRLISYDGANYSSPPR